MQRIQFRGGNTYTHRALEFVANHMLLPRNGAREVVSKLVVIVTDGQSASTEKTIAAADAIKAKGKS